MTDITNRMFNLAVELVNKSSRNIFLTGKAGTGKTTFLKYIRDNCPKQLAIVAPTGVAAINAGGVTIHSFFQLPFTPFIPGSAGFNKDNNVADIHSLLEQQRLTREKKKVIQELELLIIDEISMVRCDVLDAIDAVMRHVRHRRFERFGGVQVLLIGDMFQLPPVVPEPEWRILSEYYSSPYFFDSKVMQQEPPLYIEFDKIYRQSEQRFIKLLNQVRNNEMTDEANSILNSCFQPGFRRSRNDGYIILTTHNRKADAINELELGKLDSTLYTFDALIEGEFFEKSYPADERLYLKIGAQVMFIKNDLEKVRRYYNGKIGKVTRIVGEKIFVQCVDESGEIEVKKETWDNIRYVLNKKTNKVDEDVLGSFKQYPLRLAWAITIHKSQGLTFDKAIIDAGEAFAPGQVYVALSRCTSLSGMVLLTRIRQSSLSVDGRIVAFSKENIDATAIESELASAKRNYELSLLTGLFDFENINAGCRSLVGYVTEHNKSFTEGTIDWLKKVEEYIIAMRDIGTRFQAQLKAIYSREPFDDGLLQDRIKAAGLFFGEKLNESIGFVQTSTGSTDSGQHAKEYNDALKEIFVQLCSKRHMLQGFETGFSIEIYQEQKRSFKVPAFSVNAFGGSAQAKVETPHPALYMQLKMHRDSICSRTDLPIYLVAGSNTLFEMSRYLPQTLSDLKKINGFGEAKVKKYGQAFLDIIIHYCDGKGLESLIHERTLKKRGDETKPVKASKVDTKAASYKMFRDGLSIQQIAAERSLSVSTIETHLAWYIQQGLIRVDELVIETKLEIIEQVLSDFTGSSLTIIKEKCGPTISFGDIKMVIAWKKSLTGVDQNLNG